MTNERSVVNFRRPSTRDIEDEDSSEWNFVLELNETPLLQSSHQDPQRNEDIDDNQVAQSDAPLTDSCSGDDQRLEVGEGELAGVFFTETAIPRLAGDIQGHRAEVRDAMSSAAARRDGSLS